MSYQVCGCCYPTEPCVRPVYIPQGTPCPCPEPAPLPTAVRPYYSSGSIAALSVPIPSGGAAIPEGAVTLPVADTAVILPLSTTASSGLTAVPLPGAASTDNFMIRIPRSGFYRYDANACFAAITNVIGPLTSDDFRVLYAYVYTAAGVNRQLRVASQPAVGGATPTCMDVSGADYFTAGDRIYFAARQTSVDAGTVPITVFRASVSAN